GVLRGGGGRGGTGGGRGGGAPPRPPGVPRGPRKNGATATTSRKPTEAKKLNAAKFSPPVVARSTSPGAPLPGCGGPPSSNAPTRTHGSASRMSAATIVRLRRNWRIASTRSGRVRRGGEPGAPATPVSLP